MSNNDNDDDDSLGPVLKELEQCKSVLERGDEIGVTDAELLQVFQQIERIEMTKELLAQSQIAVAIRKYKKRYPDALRLIRKWKRAFSPPPEAKQARKRLRQAQDAINRVTVDPRTAPQCTDVAQQALQEYRQLVSALKREGKAKPDMVAYKQISRKYRQLHERYGEIPGVPIGCVLWGRGEAAIVGIHRSILSGIDAKKDFPCYAVCMSGGYQDDDATDDGTIYYTGAGGRDAKGRMVADQTETAANASLLRSIDTKQPIRLLRRVWTKAETNHDIFYLYEGLYRCVDYTHEASKEGGFKVYKFELKPIPGKHWKGTTVEQPESRK